MAELGIRPCDISRQLKVSHGCISKLLSKYNDTGSFEPGRAQRKTSRDVSTEVKNKIEEYRRAAPGIFSWEVKEKLVADGLCTKETLPPLTVISRMLRRVKSTGSDYMDKSEAENSDVESEGDTSSNDNGSSGEAKPRPKRRSFSIANILSINEETRTVSLPSSSSPSPSQEKPGKRVLDKSRSRDTIVCWEIFDDRKYLFRLHGAYFSFSLTPNYKVSLTKTYQEETLS